jgi:predicted acylesterase/phospholipase RssA
MQQFNEGGPIIAVDVSVEADLAENYQFETSLSGWKVLWSRLNPFQPTIKTPPLSETLIRIMEFNSVRRNAMERDLATLYIEPAVQGVSALDLKTYEKIIDIGYQAGRREIQAWLTRQPASP